jgi:hypothetical protein
VVSASNSIEARSGDGPLFESDGGIEIDQPDHLSRANDRNALKQEQGDTERPPTAHGVCRGFYWPGELLFPRRRSLVLMVGVARSLTFASEFTRF